MSAKTGVSKLIKALFLAGMLGASQGAMAGWGGIVYDPTNWVQNAASAAQSANIYAQQVQQYITQLEELYHAQLQRIPAAAGSLDPSIKNTVESIANAKKLYESVQTLYGRVEDVESRLKRRTEEIAASKLSPQQWFDRSVALAKSRGESAQSVFKREMQTIDSANMAAEKVRELQVKVPHTQGMHEAMQYNNVQMGMLLESMNDMRTLIAQQGMVQSEEAMDRSTAEVERRKAEYELLQKRANERAEAARSGSKTIEGFMNYGRH